LTKKSLEDVIDKSQLLFYFDVQPGDEMHLKTSASEKMLKAFPRMRARVKQFVDTCPFCQ
jgi:hypothetical protein